MPDRSHALVERIERTSNPDKCRILTCQLLRELVNRIEVLEGLEKERVRERDENR